MNEILKTSRWDSGPLVGVISETLAQIAGIFNLKSMRELLSGFQEEKNRLMKRIEDHKKGIKEATRPQKIFEETNGMIDSLGALCEILKTQLQSITDNIYQKVIDDAATNQETILKSLYKIREKNTSLKEELLKDSKMIDQLWTNEKSRIQVLRDTESEQIDETKIEISSTQQELESIDKKKPELIKKETQKSTELAGHHQAFLNLKGEEKDKKISVDEHKKKLKDCILPCDNGLVLLDDGESTNQSPPLLSSETKDLIFLFQNVFDLRLVL